MLTDTDIEKSIEALQSLQMILHVYGNTQEGHDRISATCLDLYSVMETDRTNLREGVAKAILRATKLDDLAQFRKTRETPNLKDQFERLNDS